MHLAKDIWRVKDSRLLSWICCLMFYDCVPRQAYSFDLDVINKALRHQKACLDTFMKLYVMNPGWECTRKSWWVISVVGIINIKTWCLLKTFVECHDISPSFEQSMLVVVAPSRWKPCAHPSNYLVFQTWQPSSQAETSYLRRGRKALKHWRKRSRIDCEKNWGMEWLLISEQIPNWLGSHVTNPFHRQRSMMHQSSTSFFYQISLVRDQGKKWWSWKQTRMKSMFVDVRFTGCVAKKKANRLSLRYPLKRY